MNPTEPAYVHTGLNSERLARSFGTREWNPEWLTQALA